MLTPIDIQNRQLKQKMGGYDGKDTDDFLNEVIANYEELYKENQALKEKITSLSEGIQYYKKMEGTLQKTAEIDALRAEAQAQAEVTKAKANRELEETRNHVRKLVQSYENYRLQFKKLAEAQIEMLESESFSIFVPELDELMNEAPSADSVMDNPGIIPINIGSPAPFVDLPDETTPEKSVSNASIVEELPVSIAIPVSSTEPFTAPPADDMESSPSIDLNVTSSVIEGAFVSPDDDIPEENAFIEPSANSGVPTAETPMAPAAESPFMDIPMTPVETTVPSMDIPATPVDATVPSMGIPATPVDATVPSMDIPATPVDATVPSMGIPATPVDATVPSMDIPATPVDATVPSMDIPVTPVDATVPSMDIPVTRVDATVPSMDIPITPTGETPGVGTAGNSVESIASSMEVPITPSSGTPITAMDGILPSMDTAATNIQTAGTAEASPFVDIPAAEPAASNSYQSPFVDPAADNTFMEVPVSQNTVPAQTNQAMPAMNNNAFMDIPVQTPPENNAVNMDMQATNPINPAMQANTLPVNPMQPNQTAPAMNNAFVDMSMDTSAGNNPANMGMPAANPAMQANQAAPVNNAFVDIPMDTSPENNPANMGMPVNPMQANPMQANPMQPNPMQPNPMQVNPMQANPIQPNQAAPAMNNAFMDIPAGTAPENNPANMGMQMDNPFMDIPMETPAADASMMDPAQAATAAGGMLTTEPQAATPQAITPQAAEPQAAAPADNSSLMADPFMDVGSMFDSPINDLPAEQEPAPEQNKQSVENFLDINPFNFIDPE